METRLCFGVVERKRCGVGEGGRRRVCLRVTNYFGRGSLSQREVARCEGARPAAGEDFSRVGPSSQIPLPPKRQEPKSLPYLRSLLPLILSDWGRRWGGGAVPSLHRCTSTTIQFTWVLFLFSRSSKDTLPFRGCYPEGMPTAGRLSSPVCWPHLPLLRPITSPSVSWWAALHTQLAAGQALGARGVQVLVQGMGAMGRFQFGGRARETGRWAGLGSPVPWAQVY
ncbi:hypothetical protein CCHR01_02992 [Colletotrichum chrysophilum]|uniref:Uncharacterized protein n=1 Tax=Colletotrichum chrysophilum TaxID=1836956 RepID=A0AAD9ERU5_9PEZI|nr:hypothetical protein CCHR01_02992 [Colletotrichum chrysophilum]